MKKNLSNLIEDIYKTLEDCANFKEEDIKRLSNSLASTITNRLAQPPTPRTHLSLSSIGKPLRKIWYDLKEPVSDIDKPYDRLKFLYGDIVEDIILWLAEVSGHIVTDRQKEVKHYGIVGHIDSIIDGEVVDAKSASPRSYQKFSKGTLIEDDPFGYLAQLKAYDEETGNGHPAFFAMNKVTGEICLYSPDVDMDMPDTQLLIEKCKNALDKDTPPDAVCYTPIADGKSGNMKLDKGCVFCPHKFKCWKGLRAFKYSDGIRYLSTIVNEPKVEEITFND